MDFYIVKSDELTHWGIKGQKHGRRRYQYPDGSLTPEGVIRYRKKNPEGYEKLKQETLKSGSARAVLSYKGDLTNKELQEVSTRLDYESRIKGLADKTETSGADKIKSVSDKVGVITDATKKGIEAWNVIAKITNAFSDKELPTIDGVSKAEKAAKKKKDAEEAAEKARKKDREKFLMTATPRDIIAKYNDMTPDELKTYVAISGWKDKVSSSAASSSSSPAPSSSSRSILRRLGGRRIHP